MRPPKRSSLKSSNEDTRPPFATPLQHKISRLSSFDPREHWWNFVDHWEERRALRRAVYALAATAVISASLWFWAYPWWTRRNTFRVARQWIEAGRLQNAATVIQQALVNDPENPEVWRFAAEIARRRQNKPGAAGYSRRAASLAPSRPELTVEWASDALLADQSDEATRALSALAPADLAASAQAQRILGEIARRRFQLNAARDYFSAALRIDGPTAINEVPLGNVLLHSTDSAERNRGLTLLTRHAADLEWGATAMRALLSDALARDSQPAMIEWAERLRAHPRCTLGDVPNCLLALARADTARFHSVLETLEKKHAVDGDQAALLLDWLNQIGRPDEGLRWALTLPTPLSRKAPVIVAVAEAMRRTSAWTDLDAWVAGGEWNSDLEFIRLAYATLAARQLRDSVRAEQLWRTLRDAAAVSGVRALFAGNLFYGWDWKPESLALLQIASELPGTTLQALGALARHYQLQRDGAGQHQIFRRLYSLRPHDPDIANNYAFFAALTGDVAVARKIAEDNQRLAPANATYRATYAFVLTLQGRPTEALDRLRSVADQWRTSPAVAFAYGLALAGAGKKQDARPILESLDPTTLTLEEIALIKATLN